MGEPAGAEQQHPAVECEQGAPERLAEPAGAPHGTERHRHGVDEDGHRRDGVDGTEQLLQGLREAVVDEHPFGHRQVDVRREDLPDDVPRGVRVDRERSPRRPVVADSPAAVPTQNGGIRS